VLEEGYRTADIMQPGLRPVGTMEMAELVAERVEKG
jgi:3-isopropylmalate dehydrogenase